MRSRAMGQSVCSHGSEYVQPWARVCAAMGQSMCSHGSEYVQPWARVCAAADLQSEAGSHGSARQRSRQCAAQSRFAHSTESYRVTYLYFLPALHALPAPQPSSEATGTPVTHSPNEKKKRENNGVRTRNGMTGEGGEGTTHTVLQIEGGIAGGKQPSSTNFYEQAAAERINTGTDNENEARKRREEWQSTSVIL